MVRDQVHKSGGLNKGRIYYTLFGGNSTNFYADMLTPEEFGFWVQARKLRGQAQSDAGTLAALNSAGLALQFVPVIGNVVGNALIGTSTLLAGSGNLVAGGVGALSGAAPGTGGLAAVGQVGTNLGSPGAKLANTVAKAGVPGQSATAQTGYVKEAAANVISTAGVVGGAVVGPAAGAVAGLTQTGVNTGLALGGK